MYGEGKGSEKYEEENVDKDVDRVEPFTIAVPFVVEEASHKRVFE